MNNNWKILVLLQKKIAEITDIKQSNISRMFALKYTPTLQTFLIISKALKINFFFEDQESKTNLNKCFERAMEELGRRPDELPRN